MQRSNKEAASFPERFFENTLTSGRLSHAYLMLGADMPAIMAFCRRLAARLFGCEEPAPGGGCALCRRIAEDNHPDYYHLKPPIPGGKVKIELTREVRQAVNMSRFEAPYRIVVIEHAELMTEAAQNQVLKTLEEPPEATVIILAAPSTSGLLPTVVSRCVPVRFEVLGCEAILATLGEGGEQAEWLSRVSAGSSEAAVELRERGAFELNEFFLYSLAAKPGDWVAFSETLLASGSNSGSTAMEKRWWLRTKLDILAICFRDALLVSLDIGGVTLYNERSRSKVKKICGVFGIEEILEALDYIADLQDKIESNLNPELVCDCLAQRLLFE